MTLESKSLESLIEETADGKKILFLARWLQNELDRFKQMETLKADEAVSNYGSQSLKTLLELITGNYIARWSDPQIHANLLTRFQGGAFQTFILNRLATLGLIEEFSRAQSEQLLNMLSQLNITPNISSSDTVPQNTNDGVRAVFEALTPNKERLKVFFLENHWMLLLLLAIASFNLLGYDRAFYN